ncbi:outer membrane lipid asymmetry maintenance protein MlaD [Alphaproteobacteria bacterium]|nr:outer membrane lipid asymmetry maintenance protein MlaD [Alphaproteobacteria bacterium]
MEKGRAFETIVGFFVLLVASFFFYFVYNQSSWKKIDGYTLSAKFDRADGLADGVDVKLSGVRIGKILSVNIDPETFLAFVKFSVPNNIQLPTDSSASVQSDGLFGGRYLALTPGGAEENIKQGGEIQNTVGPTNLESLIGKFMMSKDSEGSKDSKDFKSSEDSREDSGDVQR